MESEKELRADAQRNRDSILKAARVVFAERGLDAPLEEIAAHAGVGIATLYRRFPTKVGLIETTFKTELEHYVAFIEKGLADPDPWQGFASTVLGICETQASDRALADLVTVTRSGYTVLEELSRHGSDLIQQLMQRAQASGDLRADFTPEDLVMLFMATAGMARRTHPDEPHGWRRIVEVFMDGLRAEARTTAPTKHLPGSGWNSIP